MTSVAVRCGFADIVNAVTPAASGVALEVPPKVAVTPPPAPVVVVMPRPVTLRRRYSCTLFVGAQIAIPVP